MGIVVSSFLFTSIVYTVNDEKTSIKDAAVNQLNVGAKEAGYGENPQDPRLVVNTIVMFFVSLFGSIMTLLFVYAGYLFLTSHGEESKLTTARQTAQAAVIGLIIVLFAYSIAYFVGKRAQEITGTGKTTMLLETIHYI